MPPSLKGSQNPRDLPHKTLDLRDFKLKLCGKIAYPLKIGARNDPLRLPRKGTVERRFNIKKIL